MAHDYPELVGKAWVNGDISSISEYYYAVADSNSNFFYRVNNHISHSSTFKRYKLVGGSLVLYSSDPAGSQVWSMDWVTASNVDIYSDINKTSVFRAATEPPPPPVVTVVPFPTPTREPTSITLSNAHTPSSYTSNAWVVPPWTLVNGSFPSLVLNASPVAYVPYNNFTNFPAPTQVPTNITTANAKIGTSYTTNTWVAPPWTFNANQYPSHVLVAGANPYAPYNNFLNFPTPTQQPSDITNPQSRTSVHYATNTWDVVDVWWVQEGERPRFISEKATYDYVIQIRSQTESVFIALFTDNVSSIKVKMPDGVVASVGLVEINATDASVIRVMTSAGLMALQKVEV